MISKALSLVAAASALALSAGAAHAAPWSRAFAVEWFEPAMYFGAADTHAADAPGTDCPQGINPENDWKGLLRKAGYTQEQAEGAMAPEGPYAAQKRAWLAARGPNKTNIFSNPGAWNDPGMLTVTGTIGEGFDLDHNASTGFTSPDGKTHGIDNNFYKVGGCTLMWRGLPREGFEEKYSNDNMRDGRHTLVVVISGNGTPMNDPDARIGFYGSPDHLSKDGNGNMAADFTYKIEPDPKYESVAAVKIENGVITTKAPTELHMHDYVNDRPGLLDLYQGQIRLTLKADGTLSGLVGGYTPWLAIEKLNGSFVREEVGHYDINALHYALVRNADGMPDARTGQNTAISTAYRLDAVPAFVTTPRGDRQVTVAELYQPDAADTARLASAERQAAAALAARRGAATTPVANRGQVAQAEEQ